MKTDNYLALCLEQASNSNLHYRHGCIIVNGGKVIGQGFNDNCSGFDGGALKTGSISTGPSDSKLKTKSKTIGYSPTDCDAVGSAYCKAFTPFENMGGGHNVNTPLTMHSEMMAIQSALAASSTKAATTALSEKPCFKLSGRSKRDCLLRREGLKKYVQRVCNDASANNKDSSTEQRRGPTQVQEWRFGTGASQSGCDGRGGQQQRRADVSIEECRETPSMSTAETSTSWSSGGFSTSPSRSRSVRPYWTTRTTRFTTLT